VRSKDDAEDVVQDTWLAALLGVERFEGRASLRTWLLRILCYRARSAGERASRAIPASQLGGGHPDAGDPLADRVPVFMSPAPGPEELLVASELSERIEACLGELPTRQRDVLRLRDIEGMSLESVCRTMALTPGNQRVLLHRARHQVRRRLRELDRSGSAARDRGLAPAAPDARPHLLPAPLRPSRKDHDAFPGG
jgi:RNA polymerase sigma-70 factor (ECF subfamily)